MTTKEQYKLAYSLVRELGSLYGGKQRKQLERDLCQLYGISESLYRKAVLTRIRYQLVRDSVGFWYRGFVGLKYPEFREYYSSFESHRSYEVYSL